MDVQIGPWAYVSLRGESINDFPAYSTVTEILQDTSLSPQGLIIRAMVCCNLLESSARRFWLLEIDNGKPAGLFDSLQGLMPVTVEATRRLRITGFLLTKTETCCPVLKSKELEQVAGKLARKERPSVSIAVRRRTAWLRATHQGPPRSTAKVKKSVAKRSPTAQKQLGRFFGGSRRHTGTKPAAKTRTDCGKKDPEVCNRSSKKPAEGEPGPGVKAQLTLHICPEGKEDETGPRIETRAQPGLGVEQDLQLQVDSVLNADPGKALSGGDPKNTSREAIKADYGVISLFDGVSTVVPALQKKLGYPPVVAILAEIDGSLRALVCAEFGYRPDQSWGRSKSGSACLYVKDVNSLLEDGCRRLHEAVAIAPGIKWIVVGGSPCQDLTFAGAFRGVLGLVGKNSRLFFTLLGVIRAMQDLVSKRNVRFLVENAGSMIDLHYQAFCTLLGIPPEPRSNYVWDPAEHGYGITRKRNFFRGHKDRQPIQNPQKLSPVQGGPLLLQSGQPITFPPLLRTRDLLPFEVCWSSWTLYQPCSLVWDYDFWGGPDAFRRKVVMHQGKVPQLQWEDIIPPPFLQPWRKFISLLQSNGTGSKGFDDTIKQLIPMFNGSQIRLPIRTLKEREVLQLSGLDGIWSHTSLDDAERLPERVIRDYCGNSFHPDLISSALGGDQCLQEWVNDTSEGSESEVASQNTVLQVYTHLCQEVEQIGIKQGLKFGAQLVKDFPLYPDHCDPHRRVEVPRIHDAPLVGPRPPKQTKQERFQFCCNQAAVHHLGVSLCQALRNFGLEVCFDAFRTPATAIFQFEEYIRFLFGLQDGQVTQTTSGQGPDLLMVNQIRTAFQRLDQQRTRIALLDCLLAAGCSHGSSKWPVGHFVVFREGPQHQVFYIGAEQPKLILLVLEDQYGQPSMWVIGASAYRVPLLGGQSVPRVIESATRRSGPDPDNYAWVEHKDGITWLNMPLHTSKPAGCAICLLTQIKELAYCPIHSSAHLDPAHLAHVVCTQEDNAVFRVAGWVTPFSDAAKFWIFHVIRRNDGVQIFEHDNFVALPQEVTIHSPCSDCPSAPTPDIPAGQFNQLLVKWPFQDSRHFLIRTGGDPKQFEHWLLTRSLTRRNEQVG